MRIILELLQINYMIISPKGKKLIIANLFPLDEQIQTLEVLILLYLRTIMTNVLKNTR